MSTKSLDQKYILFFRLEMPSSIKLTYFDARGRAETSRLILAYANVHFEDERLTGLCPFWIVQFWQPMQCLSTCIWCEAQQIRLILMKIWTDLTWNSVDNLIIRRAIWWTEALPDLWTGLATQCPAENTVIHESYWHMDVDRYTVYIIQCIL